MPLLVVFVAITTTSHAQPVIDASTATPDQVATSLMPVPIFKFATHTVAFSPDGETLASGDGNGLVRLWDVRTGELKAAIPAHTNWTFSIAWSPNGRLIVTGGGDNTIRIFESANPHRPSMTFTGHSNDVHAVAITRDGSRIVSTGDDKDIIAWNARTGTQLSRWRAHGRQIPSLDLSPDDEWIASGSRDHSIGVWDLESGALRHLLTGHAGDVLSVRFSPDGKMLASASYDQTVRLWDAAAGRALRVLRGHTNRVFSVAFSPDGVRLASAGDSTLRIWKTATGEQLHAIHPGEAIKSGSTTFPENLSSVAFSPDGRTVAVSSTTGAITLVDGDTGKTVRRFVPNADGSCKLKP